MSRGSTSSASLVGRNDGKPTQSAGEDGSVSADSGGPTSGGADAAADASLVNVGTGGNTAALATRSHATPSTSTRANSSTASDGPR